MSIAADVERGVEWFDEVYPGWADRVNLETLDLGNGRFCIVAQVTGLPYWEQLKRLTPFSGADAQERWMQDRGFDVRPAPDSPFGESKDYDRLTAEWMRVISMRRGCSIQASNIIPGVIRTEPEVTFEGTVLVGGKEIVIPNLPLDYVMKLVEANK